MLPHARDLAGLHRLSIPHSAYRLHSHQRNTRKPHAQLPAQGAAARCVRRIRRIPPSPQISDDRAFQYVHERHVRAGRRCVACFSLRSGYKGHGRFPHDAERELKSVTHSTPPFTPSPQQHFKHRYSLCACSLLTTAFTRTQRVLPTSPMLESRPYLALLQTKRPFALALPSPIHNSENQTIPRSKTSAP